MKRSFFSNFSTLSRGILLLVLGVLTLSGCEDLFAPKVATICQDNPQYCDDLNTDGWCRAEKADIIKHRYEHPKEDDDKAIYQLMLKFEDYQSCITKASGIQHKKHREKEADRMKGVITAQKELKRLYYKTRDSDSPYLAYYHWARFSDEKAKERFMAAANAGRLDSPDLQIALASVQIKRDLNKAKASLYRALSMYKDDDNINPAVFNTLTTIAMEQEKYKVAYIWTLVASHYQKNINEAQQQAFAQQFQLPVDVLEDVADEISDALADGNFDAEKLGLTHI